MTKTKKRGKGRADMDPGSFGACPYIYPATCSGYVRQVAEAEFNLEGRTLAFARNCIDICRSVSRNTVNQQLVGQLVRAAGSVGANYREANDAATKKQFYHRIGICRTESKESGYWLRLLLHANPALNATAESLIDEAGQLTRIFASICRSQP